MWQQKIGDFSLYFVFYSFIIFSFFGWIYETTLLSVKNKTFINRGFLNGPLIPIYGFGGTIVYVTLFSIRDQWYTVFLVGMLIATVLEYVTSYVMELIFHTKWWDYSYYKYNLKGRIAVKPSLFWGFLSVVDLYLFGAIVTKIIDMIPYTVGIVCAYVIIVLGVADLTVTTIYALDLHKRLESLQHIREEFATYLIGTKIYEKSEELKERIEHASFMPLTEYAKTVKEEIMKRVETTIMKTAGESEKEDKKHLALEVENRFKNFVAKYQRNSEDHNIVHRRLLKAFPHMKIKNRDHILNDMKQKIFNRK